MKLLIPILLCLVLMAPAQQLKSNFDDPAYNHLRKAKNKKRTAHILAISGSALFITGVIIGRSGEGIEDNKSWTGLGVGTAGVLAGLASIPFYVYAKKHKNKAITINPHIGFQRTSYYPRPNPAAGLSINL